MASVRFLVFWINAYSVFSDRRRGPSIQTHRPQLRLSDRGAGQWLSVHQACAGRRQWILPVSSQQRCWS